MARPGRPAMPKPQLSKWVDTFLDMLSSERGAALNTRHAYWRDLADVSLYIRENRKREIENATTDDLKSYLQDLSSKIHVKGQNSNQIAVRTVARRLSALRQFYRYLVSENVRKDDPTTTIESPKQTRTLPKTLSEGEVDQLIKTATAQGGAESVSARGLPHVGGSVFPRGERVGNRGSAHALEQRGQSGRMGNLRNDPGQTRGFPEWSGWQSLAGLGFV